MERIVGLLRRRTGLVFAALAAPAAIVTAVLGWQAIESQQVKTSLEGGLDGGTLVARGEVGSVVAFGTAFVNTGDATVTLDDVGLIAPTDGIELAAARAAPADPGFVVASGQGIPTGTHELEGFDVAPGEAVGVIVGIKIGREGDSLGFDGLRIHFHSGGRAGEAVDHGVFAMCTPSPSCEPSRDG